MKDVAAVFVTDNGFLVPSLVAARQLLSFGIDRTADILIYLVNVDPAIAARLETDFAATGIRFIPLDESDYLPRGPGDFFRGHVPVTTLARLVLGRHLDPAYRNIVYIDGDVQILRDPGALFAFEVPEGKIAAARGGAWIQELEGTPQYENLDRLGLSAMSYFNAGILAFSRTTWIEKAEEALDFFLEHPDLCKVHDQTALNVVFRDNVVELSPLYNFHHLYTDCGAHRILAPVIVHFTGPGKPWSTYGPPWSGRFVTQYDAFSKEFPYLAGYVRTPDLFSAATLKSHIRALRRSNAEKAILRNRIGVVVDHVRNGDFAVA